MFGKGFTPVVKHWDNLLRKRKSAGYSDALKIQFLQARFSEADLNLSKEVIEISDIKAGRFQSQKPVFARAKISLNPSRRSLLVVGTSAETSNYDCRSDLRPIVLPVFGEQSSLRSIWRLSWILSLRYLEGIQAALSLLVPDAA